MSIQRAEAQLDALLRLKEDFTVAPEEKKTELQHRLDDIRMLLKDVEHGPSKAAAREVAKVLYIEGRAQDSACEDYCEAAEAMLSKATKLDPQNVSCWNALGECLWKKKDLLAAQDCFLGSLQQAPNKEALRLLSVLMRKVPAGSKEDKVSNMHESFRKAKEAVALDLDDPKSWYFLGNAYLARYFSLSHDVEDLTCALKTYQKSEKLGRRSEAAENPDLYFNRAEVYCYLEEYAKAEADWQKAEGLDPSLGAKDKIEHLRRHMDKLCEAVRKRGKIKPKKLKAVAASLTSVLAVPEELRDKKESSVERLEEGLNEDTYVKVKVLKQVRPATDIPASFLVADKQGKTFLLSVYNVDSSYLTKLRAERDVLHLLNPRCKAVEWGSEKFRVVQTTSPLSIFVNGKSLDVLSFAHAAITTTSF